MRGRQRGFTILEMTVAAAIGVLVFGSAAALVHSARSVNLSAASASQQNATARAISGGLRDLLAQASTARVKIRELPDGNTSLEFDYVVAHVFGNPIWGADFATLGELMPTSEALAGVSLGSDYTPGPMADNLDAIRALREATPHALAASERFFTVTRGTGADQTCMLYRALVDLFGRIVSTDLVASSLAVGVPSKPGFRAEIRGETVWVTMHLVDDSGAVRPVEFSALPRN